MTTTRRLWIGIVVLIALSPLGLILPARFNAGSAWGEWSGEELARLVGYLPPGLQRLEGAWKAPLPDYSLPGEQGDKITGASIGYILCGLVGVVIVTALAYGLGRLLTRREEAQDDS